MSYHGGFCVLGLVLLIVVVNRNNQIGVFTGVTGKILPATVHLIVLCLLMSR